VESTKRSREGREEVAQQCSIGTAAVLHTVVPWRISADGSIPPLPHLLFFRISTLKERHGLNKLRIREFYSNAANSKERRETRNAAANSSTDFLAPPLHVSRSLARCNDARSHARTRAKPRTLPKGRETTPADRSESQSVGRQQKPWDGFSIRRSINSDHWLTTRVGTD
jgi:hypothetical protein